MSTVVLFILSSRLFLYYAVSGVNRVQVVLSGFSEICCCCCCVPTPMTLASGGGESDIPACGPPASFSVHLASSAVTPAGSVHKSRGDNVVRMWVQLT